MSHEPPPQDNDAAVRAAATADSRILEIQRAIPTNADMDGIYSAMHRARHALRPESITAALRAEDASHVTARLDLVIAALHELNVTTAHLVELAEKLRDDSHRVTNAVERFDDNDL